MTVTPIPAGYTSLTPFLVIEGAAAAIDFYTSVFGAQLVEKMAAPDGDGTVIAHAELDFGNGRLQLGDPNPQFGLRAPDRSETVTQSMTLYCPDVDAVVERARQSGATIREELHTFVTGDRFASLLDPFGLRWTVMTRVEDVDAVERDRRLAQWAQENLA